MELYRWRKSTSVYKETSQTVSAGTDLLALVGLTQLTGFHFKKSKPSVSNYKYQFTSSDYESSYNTTFASAGYMGLGDVREKDVIFYVPKMTQLERNGGYVGGVYTYTYTADKALTMYKYAGTAGTFVEYVYSTNSSQYPDGGISGDYYYDSRTAIKAFEYVGVGNVARQVVKKHVGVDGVARKCPKIYVGVNGVARICFVSIK